MNAKGKAERRLVMERDRECFLHKLDSEHICRGPFGDPHSPYAMARMTVDHFHLHVGGTKGKRADDDRYHMVAMCAAGNGGCPSHEVREAERAYIHDLYPSEVAA